MILIDTNILLYAADKSSPFHLQSVKWINNAITSKTTLCFSWVALLGFLRISTSPKIFKRPLTFEEAMSFVNYWISLPFSKVLEPTSEFAKIFYETIKSGQALGPLIMDAHLAALALENGAKIFSNDRDFTRFKGLEVLSLQ